LRISDKIISERKLTHASIVSLQEQIDALQQDLKTSEAQLESVQTELEKTTSELDRVKREREKDKRSANSSPISAHTIPTPASPSTLSTPIPNLTMASRLTIDEVLAKNDCPALKRELRQMVTLYEDVSKLLLNERNEHRRLSASFAILVKEVKEKAPIMAQQRKEHERLISEYGILVNQATFARQRIEELEVQAGISNNEITRLQTQIVLYEEQLQSLLHETSSGEPIGDVTQGQYRNIRELVQALSHWKQRVVELEAQQSATAASDVESKLRLALQELDELKVARERQMDIMRDYMSKRDSYKVLSQSLQSERSKFMVAEEPSPADIDKETTHSSNFGNNELYRELKQEFDEYKKEQTKSYAFLEQQLDQARVTESDAKVALAKAQSENKYLSERYKDTSETLQTATSTNDHMRKKIDDYSSLLLQHQRTVDSLTNRCSELESLLRTQTATLEATKAELAIRKASEDRFMMECTSITVEKGKLQAQIDNLRSIQGAAETLAFGERQKLESKLVSAQQESAKVKLVAETERKHLYSTINSLESRQAELQAQLTASQKDLAEVREGFARAKATEESLALQLYETKSALQHSEV
jgi:nucleoprotein TPR